MNDRPNRNEAQGPNTCRELNEERTTTRLILYSVICTIWAYTVPCLKFWHEVIICEEFSPHVIAPLLGTYGIL